MDTYNRPLRFLSFSSEAGSVANDRGTLVRRRLELSRKPFALSAARNHGCSEARAWSWTLREPWQDHLHDQQTIVWLAHSAPLSDEDIRIHAYLSERLAVLHAERHGLWSKIRRLFLGDRRNSEI